MLSTTLPKNIVKAIVENNPLLHVWGGFRVEWLFFIGKSSTLEDCAKPLSQK